MNTFSVNDLRQLTGAHHAWCITLTMPTLRHPSQAINNQIRFTNLLYEAEYRLLDAGLRRPQIEEILIPAFNFLEDKSGWRNAGQSLAVFICEGVFKAFQVPLPLQEAVVVARRFCIKPLMPLLAGDGQFYILTLGELRMQLFQATRHSATEIHVAQVPHNLADSVPRPAPKHRLQARVSCPANRQKTELAFKAGHRAGSDDEDENLFWYFQKIDTALRPILHGTTAPLVVAAAEALIPIFRRANTYPHLLEASIPDHSDDSDDEELHMAAWRIVQPRFEQALHEAEAKYRKLAGTSSASRKLSAVVRAARRGEVETLFTPRGCERWGKFEEKQNIVELHDRPCPDDEDLLEYCTVQTILHGGAVYSVEWTDMPDGALVAATFC